MVFSAIFTLSIRLLISVVDYIRHDYLKKKEIKTFTWDKIDNVLLCIFIGITVLVWTVGGITYKDKERIETYRGELISLEDKIDVDAEYSRNIFVGTASIDHKLIYKFFYDSPNGIVYKEVSAKEVYIKEIPEGHTPEYVECKVKNIHPIIRKIFWINAIPLYETYLYIPEGSMTNSYDIDTK